MAKRSSFATGRRPVIFRWRSCDWRCETPRCSAELTIESKLNAYLPVHHCWPVAARVPTGGQGGHWMRRQSGSRRERVPVCVLLIANGNPCRHRVALMAAVAVAVIS